MISIECWNLVQFNDTSVIKQSEIQLWTAVCEEALRSNWIKVNSWHFWWQILCNITESKWIHGTFGDKYFGPTSLTSSQTPSYFNISFLTIFHILSIEHRADQANSTWQTVIKFAAALLGDSGRVVNSLDFCQASFKSLGCFYFRCVLSSQWKAVTLNLWILHCQL